MTREQRRHEWPAPSAQAPPPAASLSSGRPARATAPAPASDNLKILDHYLTFIHYFGYSINPSDDDSAQARRLSVCAKMAAASSAASLRLRFPDLVSRPARATLKLASWCSLPGAARWLRHSDWRALKCLVKFYAISLTAFLATNHVIVLCHYIYDREKVFTELLLELRLVITKLSALIFVISWHRNQTKVRQLIKLVKSSSLYILNEPAALAGAEACRPTSLAGAPPAQASAQSTRIKRLDWRVAKWWLMCSLITILHFSLSEAEIRTAKHLWQWLEDYSLHQLNNQTTSISSLFIMASFDNYIYTVHVYGTRLIGASVMCIVCTFQIENILYLNEQVLAALRATNTAAGPQRHSRVLDRELFFVLGESDWLQVERNRHHSPPIGWLSSTVERQLSSLRAKSGQLVRRLVTTLAGARPTPGEPSAEFAMQINRVTPTTLSPTLARPSSPALLVSSAGRAGFRPATLLLAQQIGGHNDDQQQRTTIGAQFRAPMVADFVPNSRRRAAADEHASAPKARPTPISRSRASARPGDDCDDSNQAMQGAHRRVLQPSARRALPLEQLGRNSQVAPSLGGRHFEGPLARARRLFAPTISWVPPPPPPPASSASWSTTVHFEPRDKSTCQTSCRSREPHERHQVAQALGQQLELHLDTMASKYELIRTVNSRIDNCFGRMLLSQYSFLFLMSCIDLVYFSLCFNPKTKTKYIIVSGMILLWFPYLLLYKFASDIGLASKKLLTSVRRLARLALMLQLSASSSHLSACAPGPHVCQPDKLELLSVPTTRRYRLGSIAHKLSAELGEPSPHRHQLEHRTRARIFNKLHHVFKPSHLTIVGVMTMDKLFLLNFAKIVITASVMAIQFISKG